MNRRLLVRGAAAVLVVLLLAAVPAGAKKVQSEAHVNNGSPEVVQIEFRTADDDPSTPGMQIIPTPGGTRDLTVRALVRDDNGHPDVSHVNLTLVAPDGTTAVEGPLNGTFVEGHGRTARYDVTFHIPHWLPPGTYHVEASAADHPGDAADHATTFEVLETMGIATSPSSADFPDLDPGATTDSVPITVANLGNVAIDVEVSGTDLAGPNGASIPADRVLAALTADLATALALSTTPQTFTGFDLAAGDASERPVYFAVDVPSGDEQYIPAGTYRGDLTISAVVDQ